jgi:hypothetical protein
LKHVDGTRRKSVDTWVVRIKENKRLGELEHMSVLYFDYTGIKPQRPWTVHARVMHGVWSHVIVLI